jgi:hypothetical protein
MRVCGNVRQEISGNSWLANAAKLEYVPKVLTMESRSETKI